MNGCREAPGRGAGSNLVGLIVQPERFNRRRHVLSVFGYVHAEQLQEPEETPYVVRRKPFPLPIRPARGSSA
ncbi:hypothetical protein D3C71_1837440 [compost metagenome]